MRNIVITGGSSGLGAAILAAMLHPNITIFNWSPPDVDVTDPILVAKAAAMTPKQVDILINCAGLNKIDYLPNVGLSDWDKVMDTNARGIFLTTQALLSKLRGGTILNIVSNAAHVPMTCSAAYNASKAAALMLTKQLARELKVTHDITVFSVSPNKLAGTKMSRSIEAWVMQLRGWTPEQARKYQLDALPAKEETDVATLAEFITFLLSTKQRHKFLAGCDIPYGGP
jgi:NAD(P)-dependent dehydrogenase (short-subunit alcohol dehydrogenase family)